MSRMLVAIGLCVAVSGCATAPCRSDCCGENGLAVGHGGRCSDCVPPCVPACWYMPFIDNIVVHKTAGCCASRALTAYRRQCSEPVSKDFSTGFTQAYIDLAEGRMGPPSVPPSRYWSAYYRSCDGRWRVEEWYAGYHTGLEFGSQSGVSQFNRIDIWPTGCR